MPAGSRTFVHLSDIHFRERDLNGFDLNEDLRHHLEIDAREVASRLDKIDGILVTGDVAFAGKKSEYEEASRWLQRLSDIVGCAKSEVWAVPGNHDVNRSELGPVIREIRQNIRNADNLDELLRTYLLEQEQVGELLISPFSNYNDFASKFGCQVSRDGLYWEEDFVLGQGWKLRIRGVHSAIISNVSDDTQSNKLVLGEYQAQIKSEAGVINVVLCHHPPDWLADYEVVENYFNGRTSLQLFGHKHDQKLRRIEDSLQVVSGAVHPSRDEGGWEPRYNFVSLEINSGKTDPELRVTVYPRVWEGTEFVPDRDYTTGEEYRTYCLPVERPPDHGVSATEAIPVTGEDPVSGEDEEEKESEADFSSGNFTSEKQSVVGWEADMDPHRDLLYRYHSLPYHNKLSVALDLGLVEDEDEGIPPNELFNRVLERASERDKLAEIWDRVEESHGDDRGLRNPFD